MPFITDINTRERRRFIQAFQAFSDSAAKAAQALEDNDDMAALALSVVMSLTWSGVASDFTEACRSGLSVEVPDSLQGA